MDREDRGCDRLITEFAQRVTCVCGFGSGLRRGVSHHIVCGAKGGDYIACFDVLLAEVFAHVDMTHCGLVRRMEAHGDSALVVAIYGRGFGVAEAQVKKEHA